MPLEILTELKKIFSQNPQTGKQEIESGNKRKDEESYDFKPNRNYEIMGGEGKELLTNCSSCGGSYRGPLAGKCEYCGTTRKVFYRDVGPKMLIFGQEISFEEDSVFPDFGEGRVSVDDYSTRKRAFGKYVSVGQEVDVDLLYAGEEVDIKNYAKVNVLVSPKVKTGQEVVISEAIVREADFGDYSELGLVIVIPGGNVTLGRETKIRTLVVGPNVDRISIGKYCEVEELKAVGYPSLALGGESDIFEETSISLKTYKEILQETLKKIGA